MEDLNFFYQAPLKTIKFINRKQFIINRKTLIIGNPQSGKTSLSCEHLSDFKQDERLYINLKDIRANPVEILSNLEKFIAAHPNIKALCIDNLSSQNEAEILKNINESGIENIIITTNLKTLKFENFGILELGYLDYEEFILFFRKNLDANLLFSHFLAHGNEVSSAFLDASEVAERLQNNLKKERNGTNINIIKSSSEKSHDIINAFEI
ncbi:MAG: hypothetical protein LUC34_06055 [Campylobacter sp.]|nr:hypothetical protein [Campylobacter sp.]